VKACNAILGYIIKNRNFHLKELEEFVLKYCPTIRLMPCTSSGFITAVPEEQKSQITILWNIYEKTEKDLCLVKWYLSKLFSTAKSHEVVEKCIPEYFWKYIPPVRWTGELTEEKLFDQDCFNILEESQTNNLILGITNG